MCTSESKINKKFTITTQDPTASHRISHPSTTRVPSSYILESNRLEGSWSLVQHLNQFGPEAYFPIVSTKFLGHNQVLGKISKIIHLQIDQINETKSFH
jgi:hypothetical protein